MDYGTLTYPPSWFDWYNWKGWYPDTNPFKKSKQQIKKQVDNKEIINKQVNSDIKNALTETRITVDNNGAQLKPLNKIEDSNSPYPINEDSIYQGAPIIPKVNANNDKNIPKPFNDLNAGNNLTSPVKVDLGNLNELQAPKPEPAPVELDDLMIEQILTIQN